MITKYQEREKAKLKELTKKFEADGYLVSVQPGPNHLPEFLKSFHPDLIATSGTESVYVDIKSSGSLTSSEYMEDLAEIIEQHPGWRYQLVLTNPRETHIGPLTEELLSLSELDSIYRSAKSMASAREYKAALLLLWTTLESCLRYLARKEELEPEHESAKFLIKYLFSLGLITASDQRVLETALEKRNSVAHGFVTKGIDKRTISRLSKLYEGFREIIFKEADLI